MVRRALSRRRIRLAAGKLACRPERGRHRAAPRVKARSADYDPTDRDLEDDDPDRRQAQPACLQASHEAMILWAMIALMTRRLAQPAYFQTLA